MKPTLRHLAMALFVTALTATAGQSLAATEAGTAISNTAQVEFTIDGNTSGPIPSNPVTIYVDNMIRVVVDNTSGTSVVAGGQNYALPFTVDNQSNTAANGATWFRLSTVADATDNFSMTGVEIWEDTNSDGTPDSRIDTAGVAFISIAAGSLKNIMLVADAPNDATTQTLGMLARHYLVAQAWNNNNEGAGLLTVDTDGNDPLSAETVFADAASAGVPPLPGVAPNNDVLADGKHSDIGTYTTSTPVTVLKAASDTAYHVPGNTVTYTVTVTNNAASAASAVRIDDVIPTNTTYVAGSLTCSSGTAQFSDDPIPTVNPTYAPAPEPATVTYVRCNNGSAAAAGGTTTMTFDVTID